MKTTLTTISAAAVLAIALAGPAFAQAAGGTMKMEDKSDSMKSGSMAMSADAGMKDHSMAMKPMKKTAKKKAMDSSMSGSASAGTNGMNH
jgi:hypothetical protein